MTDREAVERLDEEEIAGALRACFAAAEAKHVLEPVGYVDFAGDGWKASIVRRTSIALTFPEIAGFIDEGQGRFPGGTPVVVTHEDGAAPIVVFLPPEG